MSTVTADKPAKRHYRKIFRSPQVPRPEVNEHMSNSFKLRGLCHAVLRDGRTFMGDPVMYLVEQVATEQEAIELCRATALAFGRAWIEHWGHGDKATQCVLFGYIRVGTGDEARVVKDWGAGPTKLQLS